MNTKEIVFMALTFVVAFAFTFATVPIVHRFAFKIGAIDVPKDSRRMHKKPIPRVGGLAIIFGFAVALACFGQGSRQIHGAGGFAHAAFLIDHCNYFAHFSSFFCLWICRAGL